MIQSHKQARKYFYFCSIQSVLGLYLLILIWSYKPCQHLFQCLTAVVPWAGKALMNINCKGMPELYAAKEDVLEWTWLLYCVPVKEGRLLKGRVRAAAAWTQQCSGGVETHQTFCTLGQSRGANRNIRAHVLASELWGVERHSPLENVPIFCWGTTCNSCIHWDGFYQSGKNGVS